MNVRQALRARVKPGKKELLQRFFKTAPGEYGAGDVFFGVMVPDSRALAREFKDSPLSVVKELLDSEVHEERLVALLILVEQHNEAAKRYGDRAAAKTASPRLQRSTRLLGATSSGGSGDSRGGTSEERRARIIEFYLTHSARVNNWDLVDLSAHKLLGAWLLDKDRAVLYRLAKSKNLWKRRIAVVSTFAFIARDEYEDTRRLVELLLGDEQDLMHNG